MALTFFFGAKGSRCTGFAPADSIYCPDVHEVSAAWLQSFESDFVAPRPCAEPPGLVLGRAVLDDKRQNFATSASLRKRPRHDGGSLSDVRDAGDVRRAVYIC